MCEAVRFEVAKPLLGAAYCHCRRCQRRSGSAFAAVALAAPGSFEVTEGRGLIREWPPGDGWVKSFCSACGSHLYTTHPDNPELIAIHMGAFDEDPGVRPSAHQFVSSSAPWEPIPDDGLPRFPARLPLRVKSPD
jgi:hypothetical protein